MNLKALLSEVVDIPVGDEGDLEIQIAAAPVAKYARLEAAFKVLGGEDPGLETLVDAAVALSDNGRNYRKLLAAGLLGDPEEDGDAVYEDDVYIESPALRRFLRRRLTVAQCLGIIATSGRLSGVNDMGKVMAAAGMVAPATPTE